jgi:hypothetical protein
MAEQPQTIVQPSSPNDLPMGTREEANLQKMFPESPIYSGDITDEERKVAYEKFALDGTVTNGLGFNSFNRDYKGTSQTPTPDFDNVEVGGQGKPASAFVPNPTSPGAGSVSANDQAEFTGDLPTSGPEFGSGLGGTISPSSTSGKIASTKLGDYISGRSFQGSDGKS